MLLALFGGSVGVRALIGCFKGVFFMDKMIFENGLEHEFSDDEIVLLKKAVSMLDIYTIPFCGASKIDYWLSLAENLKSLFCDNLD